MESKRYLTFDMNNVVMWKRVRTVPEVNTYTECRISVINLMIYLTMIVQNMASIYVRGLMSFRHTNKKFGRKLKES